MLAFKLLIIARAASADVLDLLKEALKSLDEAKESYEKSKGLLPTTTVRTQSQLDALTIPVNKMVKSLTTVSAKSVEAMASPAHKPSKDGAEPLKSVIDNVTDILKFTTGLLTDTAAWFPTGSVADKAAAEVKFGTIIADFKSVGEMLGKMKETLEAAKKKHETHDDKKLPWFGILGIVLAVVIIVGGAWLCVVRARKNRLNQQLQYANRQQAMSYPGQGYPNGGQPMNGGQGYPNGGQPMINGGQGMPYMNVGQVNN